MVEFYYEKIKNVNRENLSEYHIKIKNVCLRYYDYNIDVLLFKVKEYLSKYNIRVNFDEDWEGEKYSWIHVKSDNDEFIKKIIQELNTINFNQIPNLTEIICDKFKNTKFLLDSVCEHQKIYGYDETKRAIELYYSIK